MDHFTGFQREERTMPVVWHQSLLVFVQRYKHEIRCAACGWQPAEAMADAEPGMACRAEDREALRKLIRVQYHYKISPEVSRELDTSRYCPRSSLRKPVRLLAF